MTEVMQTVDQIVALLDKFERPIEIALVVVLTMLARNVKQNTAAIAPSVPTTSTPQATKTTTKAEEKVASKAKTDRKKDMSAQMQAGLDLYFSDKAYEEMTEDEQALYDQVSAFMLGGK